MHESASRVPIETDRCGVPTTFSCRPATTLPTPRSNGGSWTPKQAQSCSPGGSTTPAGIPSTPTRPSPSTNTNDVLIGYSRFSADQYASANYAFRYGSDPAGTLNDDTVLKAGEASYYKIFRTMNRWGDYSATVVDPVNDRDLWTIQEYAETPISGSDRWGTWWGMIPVDLDTTPPVWPDAAQLMVTSVGGDQVSLSWPAASDNVGLADYQVVQDGLTVANTAATTYTTTGLVLGATYVFAIEATDLEGNQTTNGPTADATTVDTTPPVWPVGSHDRSV